MNTLTSKEKKEVWVPVIEFREEILNFCILL